MNVTSDNDSERDAGLTATYRLTAQDVPPPALDSAILAAARREVQSRPRVAGSGFGRFWRAPLAVAAVMVLSVSLVTLMREEAPDPVTPPRADQPVAGSGLEALGGAATVDTANTNEEQRPKSIGLKPPQTALPSGLGMRQPEFLHANPLPGQGSLAPAGVPLRADPVKPAQVAESANRLATVTGASSADGGLAGNKASASADRIEPEARMRAAAEPAPPALPGEAKAASSSQAIRAPSPAVAMGKPAYPADLAPEKWLERIEYLRKQGRFDEARVNLAEFRKRYPDHPLPEDLREWVPR